MTYFLEDWWSGTQKYASFISSLHMKLSFCNISLRQNNPYIMKCWYGMNWFRCFKLITGRFPPPFFPKRNLLLKDSSFKWLVWHMASFCNMLFPFVTGMFDLNSCEVFLEFFVGLDSCWKIFCIPPQVFKFSNLLSVFFMSL